MVSTFPSQNQIHVARNSQIIIGFNETIIDSTLNNNSIVAYGTLSGRHFGNIYYDSINSKMIYTPLKTFASGEKFFVSLTKEIKSISGDSLIPAFTFEFQVRSDTGYNYMTCTKYQNITGLNTIEDMKVADMDIDGDYDLVFSSYYSFLSGRRVMVFMNDGEANFQGSYYFWLPAKPTHLSIGDFNNDGVQDVAVVTSDQVLFLTNNGSGQLSNWGSVEINYSGILINCDFNNDGRIDVLGLELDDNSNPWKREVSFIKNLGDGNFEKINSYSFTSNISSERFYIDVADFNNDGFIDIIISNILLNQVYILLNNGEVIFSLGTIKYINPKPWSLTVGDFDNDSDIDLSVSKESGWEGLDIYENMGNTVFVYIFILQIEVLEMN